jgi:geranylgeranyl pyrophosphate synthase
VFGLSWEATLDHYGGLIEQRLEPFLARCVADAKAYHPFVGDVYSDLSEYMLRKGKRLASCSTLLVYKGYTGKVDEKILNVCVGIALYRHAILVHDDLVDMDATRRGGETLHTMYMNKYNPYNQRFGDGTAVFAGNIAYALANRAILESGFPAETVQNVLQLLSEGFRAVNESQILDLLFEFKDVDVAEWRAMAGNRASSLFRLTLVSGAMLAGATVTDQETLNKVAEHLGYSFDIQDDIIDSFAPSEEYGRPPCLDISKNKKPLHVIYALNSQDPSKSNALKCLLGKQFLSVGEVELARNLLRESGGLDKAKQDSKQHAQQAKTYINQTNLTTDIKQFFNSFITYIEDSLNWYK